MLKSITKLALLGALAVQFAAFAGGTSTFNTTWTPSNLFVAATNGAITTGTITVTSNLPSFFGNTIISTPFTVSYSTSNISPLGFNMASFFHNNSSSGSSVTSVIGYSIDLSVNTFVGTVLGIVNFPSNNGGNYNGNMPFTIVTEAPKSIVLPPSRNFSTSVDLSATAFEVCNQNNKTFTLSVSGSFLIKSPSPMCTAFSNTYRWYFDNNTISTSDDVLLSQFNNATLLTLSGVNLTVGGYYVKVGSCRTIFMGGGPMMPPFETPIMPENNSNVYPFIPTVSISSQPISQSTCSGSNAPLNIATTGTYPQYKWNTGATTSGINVPEGAYVVTVNGLCNNVISDQATVSSLPATQIATQPVSAQTCAGSNAAFTVSATGANLTYAWSNGLSTTNTMTTNIANTNYNVTVTGTCGRTVSTNAQLSNYTNVQYMSSPSTSQTICGERLTELRVHPFGSGLAILWNTGATTAGINVSTAGVYMVTSSGFCGAPIIENIELTIDNVSPLTAIVTQPRSIVIPGLATGTISVSAVGTNLSYRWSNGETTRSISPTVAGFYTVDVMGKCNNVTSNFAVVEILNPSRTLPMATVSNNIGTLNLEGAVSGICQANTRSFNLTISGSFDSPTCAVMTLRYRWFFDNNTTVTSDDIALTAFDGQKSISLTDANITFGGYYAIVNTCRSMPGAPMPCPFPQFPGQMCPGSPIPNPSNLTTAVQTIDGTNYATIPLTTIVSPLVNQNICIDNTVIEISATGSNLQYVWTNAPGNNSNNSTVSTTTSISVTVQGDCGMPQTTTANYVRKEPLVLVTRPQNVDIFPGQTATITVSFAGTNLTYNWSSGESGTTISGKGAGTYFVTISGSNVCSPEVYQARVREIILPTITGIFTTGNPALATVATVTGFGFLFSTNGENGVVINNLWAGLKLNSSSTFVVVSLVGIAPKSMNLETIILSSTAGTEMYAYNDEDYFSPTVTITAIDATLPTETPSSATVSGVTLSGNPANSITISGSGFVNGSTVTVNGVVLNNITVINGNTIVATLPSGFNTNSVNVVVQNPNEVPTGSVVIVNPVNNSVVAATVTGIITNGNITTITSPTLITISGIGFTNATNVTINGISVPVVASIGTNTLLVNLPVGVITSTGAVNIQVANPNQAASAVVNLTPKDATQITTKLPNYQSTSFSIYPNPTSNGEWRMENGEVGATMYVYNAQGSMVYSQTITSTSTEVNTKLSSGIYLVKVGTQMVKLVVE